MTKTCNHHFLVNQEKGEKHVFRKSKKYRTLCSIALGTMVTAVVSWGGTVAHADEVATSVDTTIQRTENPATNLPEAQPNPVLEQTESIASTGQSNGAIAVTVPHDTVTQAVEDAKAEGVSTVEDSPMDLGNTTSASETSQQISKAEADAQNQVEAINEVTETYKADKAAYEDEKVRIEQENKELTLAYEGANQTGKEINAWVDTKVNDLKTRYADADVTVKEHVVSSGNGTSELDYTNYGKAVETIQSINEQAVADYLTKKTKADDIVAKNQAIQKENEAGLAKAKADNEAIVQRNGRLIRQGNMHQEVDIYHYITKGSFDNYLWQTQENKLKYITQIMTTKDPVRSAEDIDEQTMTASDFKDLATGNPYLKLKMELENELTVLENQKRAFNRSKDEYRHTVSYCEKHLPIMEIRLSQYDKDIAQSLATKSQDFVMRFDNQAMDNRAEAGDYLRKLITYDRSETKEVKTLASFRGFDLKMTTRGPGEPLPETVSLTIVGDNQYTVALDLKSDVGTIQRISNAIDHIMDDQEKTQELVKDLKDKLRVAKVEVEKVFPKEEDYKLVKAKYDVLAPLVEKEAEIEEIDAALEQFNRNTHLLSKNQDILLDL
ncbi:putative cross-wall-targeting lipoprotein signal domain-containing proteiin [Streptococcus sp. FT1-106]|uniref:putative cross-wall-targeting lipoprotein signal domain-containing proteiin n=1 Tax=unclassified Streptococcus TaxID=2608887 RepID=UPI003BF61E30